MKTPLALTLLTLTASILLAQSDTTLRGELTQQTVGEAVFLAIIPTAPVQMTDFDGNAVTANLVQIAGLDQKQWQNALTLVGKEVIVSGTLMPAETRYHHTPILIITDQVKVVNP